MVKEQGVKAIKQEIFNLELALVKEKDPQLVAEQEALLAFYRSKLKAHQRKQVLIGGALALIAMFALIFTSLSWLYSNDSHNNTRGFAQSSSSSTRSSQSRTSRSSSESSSRKVLSGIPQELLGTWYGSAPLLGQPLTLVLERSGQITLEQEGFNGRERLTSRIDRMESLGNQTYFLEMKSDEVLADFSPTATGTVYFGLSLSQDQQTLTLVRWFKAGANQAFDPSSFSEERLVDLSHHSLSTDTAPSSDKEVTNSFVVDVVEKSILLRPTPGIRVDGGAKIKKGTRGLEVTEVLERDGLTWGLLADGRGWIVLDETSWANQVTGALGRDPRNLTTEEVENWVFAVYRERFDQTISKSELSMDMTIQEDKLLYVLVTEDRVGMGQEYRIDDNGHLQFLSGRDGWITVSRSYPDY